MKHKIKLLKLGIRNTVNKITGQQGKINQYSQIINTLITASEKENDPKKKQKILDSLNKLTEEVWERNPKGGLTVYDKFNQHNPLMYKKLGKKIETGNNLIKEFGLKIVQKGKV